MHTDEISQEKTSNAIAAQNSHIGSIHVPVSDGGNTIWPRVLDRQNTQVAICRWALGLSLLNAVLLAALFATTQSLEKRSQIMEKLTVDHIYTATTNWQNLDYKIEQRINYICRNGQGGTNGHKWSGNTAQEN